MFNITKAKEIKYLSGYSVEEIAAKILSEFNDPSISIYDLIEILKKCELEE
jgi:hypothetical protein